MSAVVVDTSVWIDFFGGRPAERLEDALRLGTIVLPPVVAAEILSGIRSRDRGAMVAFLADLELADTPFTHWTAVGNLRSSLAARGLAVSTPDAHVAQCALDRGALLLSHDAVFRKIADLAPLRVQPANP